MSDPGNIAVTLGPWKITLGNNCFLSPGGFARLGEPVKVSLHGVEVPNLTQVDIQLDGLSIEEMSQPVRRDKQDIVMVLSVKMNPDAPGPMPKTELKDHVVDELMKRCLQLEEENAELRRQVKPGRKAKQ
jgi:hypothetical protein